MIKADFQDRTLVIEILVEAFETTDNENSINFVVKQDKKRVQRTRILMGYLFDKAIKSGYVFLSDNKASCLLISFSNRERLSLSRLISTVKLVIGCIGIERVQKVLRRQRIIGRNYPKITYIKPIIFGVRKSHMGGVTAPRLVLQVLEEFKENKLPVIVDAASEKNVRLYEKFGLKKFKVEDALGFPIYMLRMN